MIRLRSQLLAGPGRILTCTRCHATVRVLEATQAATSDEQHRHLDPDTYECGECATAASDRLKDAGPAVVVSGDSILPPRPANPSATAATLCDARDHKGGWNA